MGTIATSDFLTEADRIAAMVAAIDTTFGSGSDTNTISKGGANALAAIKALNSDTQITLALLPAAETLKESTKANGYYYGALYQYLLAMHNHTGDLNQYLADNSLRVHAHCRKVFSLIQAKYTFPEVTQMGAFTGGTWTPSAGIDTDEYGDAEVEVQLSAESGGAEATLTLTGSDYDGETVQATVTIPATSSSGTTIQVNELSRRFAAITDVQISGSTADLAINTKLDRSPSGLA